MSLTPVSMAEYAHVLEQRLPPSVNVGKDTQETTVKVCLFVCLFNVPIDHMETFCEGMDKCVWLFEGYIFNSIATKSFFIDVDTPFK